MREKEKEIQKQLDEGIDYDDGKATLIALVERIVSTGPLLYVIAVIEQARQICFPACI